MTLGPKPPPDGGTGPNLIRPQTCSSSFRFAPKASFETPGESALFPLARKRRAKTSLIIHHHKGGHVMIPLDGSPPW